MTRSDVVVVGGGPSGVCAALAAAQAGSSVTLLEKAGFLGGTATGAMVAAFNGFYWGDVLVAGGIPGRVVKRLAEDGGTTGFRDYTAGELTGSPFTFKVLPFDPEVLKFVLDDLMREAGVQVVHHVQGMSARIEPGRGADIDYLGPVIGGSIKARQVVDATGHATIAVNAGAELQQISRERQPMTLMMRVSGVNHEAVAALGRKEKRRIVEHGIETGRLFYRTLATSRSPRNQDVFLLMTSVHGMDGTDEFDLTAAEVEGRRQARSTLHFLKEFLPGYESAEIAQLAPWIGVRESRRIMGRTTLTAADVLAGADHPDAISFGAGPIDLHEYDTVTLTAPKRPFAVPLGVLVPRRVDNITVAGRAVSAEAGAMDGLRHMGGVMPLGHAAGVLASLAASHVVTPSAVDPQELRSLLREQGAIVDRPDEKSSTERIA
jgi:hypothetical protein